MQDVIYMVQELMPNGDLYTALGDDRVFEQLRWYNRYPLLPLHASIADLLLI